MSEKETQETNEQAEQQCGNILEEISVTELPEDELRNKLHAYHMQFTDSEGNLQEITIPRKTTTAITAVCTMAAREAFDTSCDVQVAVFINKDSETLAKVCIAKGSHEEVVDTLMTFVMSPIQVRNYIRTHVSQLFEFSTLRVLTVGGVFGEEELAGEGVEVPPTLLDIAMSEQGGDVMVDPFKPINVTTATITRNVLDAMSNNFVADMKAQGIDIEEGGVEDNIIKPGSEAFKAVSDKIKK